MTLTLGFVDSSLASSLFMVDKPPFVDRHSVPRRITCNSLLEKSLTSALLVWVAASDDVGTNLV